MSHRGSVAILEKTTLQLSEARALLIKELYLAYILYLIKSAQETSMIIILMETSWSVLFDKGFVGSAQDTPSFL
ncbi:hypothetical protein QOT17_024566 [Balamuthia mandrillaris]